MFINDALNICAFVSADRTHLCSSLARFYPEKFSQRHSKTRREMCHRNGKPKQPPENKVVDFLSSAEKITKTPKYHANPFSLKADTTTDAKHKSGENIRDVQYLHTEGQHEAFCSVTMSRRRVMFLVHCVPRRGKKYNHS